MGDKSHIEWTDATWNPTTGCSKVSQGCKNCYALREWPRLSANRRSVYYGRKFTDVAVHEARLDQPLRWRKPRMIFVNSMSDLFHEKIPDEFIDQVFAVMALAKHHVFQVLTKRPERMLAWFNRPRSRPAIIECLAELYVSDVGPDIATRWPFDKQRAIDVANSEWPPKNVWLGVSVDDQATADERIPLLLETPAAVRWISAEPLLGPVDIRWFLGLNVWRNGIPIAGADYGHGVRLDWVVAGGESGPKARPSHPGWFRSLRDQCVGAGVPFLFKQWGEWAPCYQGSTARAIMGGTGHVRDIGAESLYDDDFIMARPGKKAAGRELDGRTWEEYPVA